MKVVKIRVSVSTRYVGSLCTDEIEVYVDDNATPEQIESEKEDACKQWMFDQIDWRWVDVEEAIKS